MTHPISPWFMARSETAPPAESDFPRPMSFQTPHPVDATAVGAPRCALCPEVSIDECLACPAPLCAPCFSEGRGYCESCAEGQAQADDDADAERRGQDDREDRS